MKKESCKYKKQEKGVTLIILVVTIVIMIILAGTTINMVFGENGALQQSKKTQDMQKEHISKEDSEVNTLIEKVESEEFGVKLPEGWDENKVRLVKSKDSIPLNVPVPRGFVASNATGENTVSGGFVIYQGTEKVNDANVATAQLTRNQFVWVPVPDLSEMFGTDKDGNTLGKLYDFNTIVNDKPIALNWKETIEENGKKIMSWESEYSYWEPQIVTSYTINNDVYLGDEVASNYSNANIRNKNGNLITNATQFKAQLKEEIEALKISIETYGGFYIGRYETGNLSENIAVVVKKNEKIVGQTWYTMYQKSKTIAKGTSATSSMIWGTQWDATLKWLISSGNKTIEEINNSKDWGNYNSILKPTGSSENYKANNIYDMAGNAWDRTIEACGINFRVDYRRRL